MADERFPKSLRLLKSAEFERVFKRRRSQSDAVLTVHACENALATARLGLVVSRKCGGAVQRNLWKRRLREAFRRAHGQMPAGVDLVVLPRAARPPATADLERSLSLLARQLSRRLQPSATLRPEQPPAP
jgi:ribonuclease P protein component